MLKPIIGHIYSCIQRDTRHSTFCLRVQITKYKTRFPRTQWPIPWLDSSLWPAQNTSLWQHPSWNWKYNKWYEQMMIHVRTFTQGIFNKYWLQLRDLKQLSSLWRSSPQNSRRPKRLSVLILRGPPPPSKKKGKRAVTYTTIFWHKNHTDNYYVEQVSEESVMDWTKAYRQKQQHRRTVGEPFTWWSWWVGIKIPPMDQVHSLGSLLDLVSISTYDTKHLSPVEATTTPWTGTWYSKLYCQWSWKFN